MCRTNMSANADTSQYQQKKCPHSIEFSNNCSHLLYNGNTCYGINAKPQLIPNYKKTNSKNNVQVCMEASTHLYRVEIKGKFPDSLFFFLSE